MFTVALQSAKNSLSMVFLLLALVTSTASADASGRGLAADFEVDYLTFIIDHHYSALRMTELAAGTDIDRNSEINLEEGTAPTPNTAPTEAKASMSELKSMARINNRAQREEIKMAQHFLRQWYDVEHTPQVTEEAQEAIELLKQVPAGREFDRVYMEVLSRHHYMALSPSLTCVVASDIAHEPLHRYCNQIAHSQVKDINDMREHLAEEFGVVDYQPTTGVKGQHSDAESETDT